MSFIGKKIQKFCDSLRDEAGKPLDEWELKESERVRLIKDRILFLKNFISTASGKTAADMSTLLTTLEQLEPDTESYGEFFDEAVGEHKTALLLLEEKIKTQKKYEEDQEELRQLRDEKEARAKKLKEEEDERKEKQRVIDENEKLEREAREREGQRLADIEKAKEQERNRIAEEARKASEETKKRHNNKLLIERIKNEIK